MEDTTFIVQEVVYEASAISHFIYLGHLFFTSDAIYYIPVGKVSAAKIGVIAGATGNSQFTWDTCIDEKFESFHLTPQMIAENLENYLQKMENSIKINKRDIETMKVPSSQILYTSIKIKTKEKKYNFNIKCYLTKHKLEIPKLKEFLEKNLYPAKFTM